ncbi:MAG: DUF3011 domain-containing protein [Gemmatimonadales bacterium]|nr:DUF3011 domain-containing protein [Gemmatimonadales bacterium]
MCGGCHRRLVHLGGPRLPGGVRDLTGRGLCRQNSSWGFGRSDIWANGGCRAEFEVTYLAASGGGNTITYNGMIQAP